MKCFLMLSLVFYAGCSFPTGDFQLNSPDASVVPPPDLSPPPPPDVPSKIDVADVVTPDIPPVVDMPMVADIPMVDDMPMVIDMPMAVDMPMTVDMPMAVDMPIAVDMLASLCPLRQIRCDDMCINPLNDRNHCGRCGRACVGAQICQFGGCQSPLSDAYANSRLTPAEVPFINACSASTPILTSVDDAAALAALPFPFRFFRTMVPAGTMVNISTNGFISFDGMMSGATSGSIPSMSAPNGVVAPFWTDLVTRATGVCVATVGTTPGSRRWIVQWNNVMFFGAGSESTGASFELILHEGSNMIDFVYNAISPRADATPRALTIGVENPSGLDAFVICNESLLNNNCGVGTNARVRLTPMM